MIESLLQQGRRAAEALMTARVEVRRYTNDTVTDPDTLKTRRDYMVVYSGCGKLQAFDGHSATPDVAGASVTDTRIRVDVPVGAFLAQTGDEVHVITDTVDTHLAGLVVRVSNVAPFKSHATAYRLQCEMVTHG